MVDPSKLIFRLGSLLLLHATLLGPCDSVRDARKISELRLQRSDQTEVRLALWATQSFSPKYFVEFNGQKHKFAGGQLESTYACVVQSPDKDRVVVMEAFSGLALNGIEFDLRTGDMRKLGGRRSSQRLDEFKRDGWTVHNWPDPLDPRTGKSRDRRGG